MKKCLVSLLLLIPLFLAAQTPCRYESGAVSFDLPEGWAVTSYPGLQYDIAAGPVRDGFMTKAGGNQKKRHGNHTDDGSKEEIPAFFPE